MREGCGLEHGVRGADWNRGRELDQRPGLWGGGRGGARAASLEAEARPPPVAATTRSRTRAPRASTLISRPIFLPLLSLRRSPSRCPRPRRALLPAGSPAAAAAGPGGAAGSAPQAPHSHLARGPPQSPPEPRVIPKSVTPEMGYKTHRRAQP